MSMTKVTNPIEGSSFSPRHVRLLKISIAIMTALLILGIVALMYGMARQASRPGTPARPAPASAASKPYDQTLELGKGLLASVSTSNNFLILHWKGAAGDLILTIDPQNGHEVGRIQVPIH
jgi:hypothetical protein